MLGETRRDVAEIDLRAHVLGGEALHQQAVPVILDALAAGDVFLVADAPAFTQVDDPPARPGRQRQAPVQRRRDPEKYPPPRSPQRGQRCEIRAGSPHKFATFAALCYPLKRAIRRDACCLDIILCF